MSDVRENLTYEQFGVAVRELAQAVADDGYEPDIVLSIARGGVFVAGGLAYALDCKNIHLVNVEFYTGVGTTLDMPVMLAPVPNVIDFSDKKVLITDDVADTGKTLKLVRDFCLDTVAEVRSAVIYEKSHSLVQCEYVWKRTDDWINFPWSRSACTALPRGTPRSASAERAWVSGTVAARQGSAGHSTGGVIAPSDRHTPVPTTHDPGRGGAAWTLSPQDFCSA